MSILAPGPGPGGAGTLVEVGGEEIADRRELRKRGLRDAELLGQRRCLLLRFLLQLRDLLVHRADRTVQGVDLSGDAAAAASECGADEAAQYAVKALADRYLSERTGQAPRDLQCQT